VTDGRLDRWFEARGQNQSVDVGY